jgi:DNA (cytosine-5)-methyltransferase 1
MDTHLDTLHSSVVALGSTSKGGRIYLQGKWLLKAGFEHDTPYVAEVGPNKVVIRLDTDGGRKVSSKSNRTIPVIDIENRQLTDAFSKCEKLQVTAHNHVITITPAHTVILVQGRKLSMTEGSLFSGGGFLSEAAKRMGFAPKFAVEYSPEYAEIYSVNHPGSVMFNQSVEQVPFDALRQFGPLGLLTMGIPCEPFSAIRTLNRGSQNKRDRSLPPEAHENGDMVFWALRAVEATNPHTVLVEEVPDFLKSGAGFVLQNVLRRMGYNVDSRVINPVEYGELTSRKRAIIVARTGAEVMWPEPVRSERTLGDILEPVDSPNVEWFDRTTKSWLFDHWEKQAAKGNGFPSQKVTALSRNVGTIKKRYFAGQGDNPVVVHPDNSELCRWFTLNEVKRLHGISDDYYLGDSKTRAGEVIGQGVHVGMMQQVLQANLSPRFA